ncbi:MAG: Spy/CpxP family protein refolding chaperone [Pseudomonadota bacterium]
MSQLRKHLLIAGLVTSFGIAAIAQTPPSAPAAGPQAHAHQRGGHMGKHDPAKMQERIAKRQADLKAKLRITASQEPAWNAFTASMQPPATRPARPSREEFAKLTTPQRIDRMQAMKTERDARMAQRATATKSFYAALSPEQQKVFDETTLRGHGGKRGGHGHHHHGGHKG